MKKVVEEWEIWEERESSKVRREGKETGPQKVSSENKNVWQETIGENAYTKDLGPYH